MKQFTHDFDKELVKETIKQITVAVHRIERRGREVYTADDFLRSEAGIDRLDAICMMLIAIGENLKNLDKITDGKLLCQYPEVDWRGAKGMRDIISHHYFDLNAEVVFSVCKDHLPKMMSALSAIEKSL